MSHNPGLVSANGHVGASGGCAPWPKTGRPLRIAILGWARLSLQAAEGSGYNLSASELASGLARSGHAVAYLAAGMRYSALPGIRISASETWRGVRCFELINSPNCAPAAVNFRNMVREMSSPSESRSVAKWLERERIDLVHVHSLEGFGLDLIGTIRDTGRPVVVTTHNYWFACPQVDLLHKETHLCDDYDGGRRCDGCLSASAHVVQRAKRAAGQTLERSIGHHAADLIRKTAYGIARGVSSSPPVKQEALDDRNVAGGFNAGAEADGEIDHGLELGTGEQPVELGRVPIDQNERFLRARHHLVVLNDYGRRRLAGIEALNRASIVTPPSDFVGRVYVKMGLEASRMRVVRLGQPHFDQINRRTRRSPFYVERPWDPQRATRPLRFGFFGTVRHNKGLDVLARAIPLLERDVRQRCQFLIRAGGWDWPFRKRLSRYPEVQFAGGYDLLQLIGAGGEYDVGILPHIWFENSPLVMLEHLHAGKLVVSSRLGGPPEWLIDGREPGAARYNALLFPGGEPEGLAEAIRALVSGEVAVPSAREVHDATLMLQSYPAHVAEVDSIYQRLIDGDDAREPSHANAEIEAKRDAVARV